MNLTRRALLQQTSLAFASFSLSQIGLSLLTRRYQRVLATPTSRRLALLIGINQYSDAVCGFQRSKGSVLQGAVTDVELHRELLISRFGFHPSDIVTLVDQQATRDGIETALQFHLLDQVKEGDVVVFHFSGLGSYVEVDDGGHAVPVNPAQVAEEKGAKSDSGADVLPFITGVQRTLVPVDGWLPKETSSEFNDLMQATLALFLGALPTQNIVSVLDVGYGYTTPLLGNLRVRSRLSIPTGVWSSDTVSLSQRLNEQQIKSSTRFDKVEQDRVFPGVLLAASTPQGVAAEASWEGFSSGVLTYTLTQQLWWSTAATSVNAILGQVSSASERIVGKDYQPSFKGIQQVSQTLPAYTPVSSTTVNADGVVLKVDDEKNTLRLCMSGLPVSVLERCSDASYVELVSSVKSSGAAPILVQGRSRDGLIVNAKPVDSANVVDAGVVGHLVHEKVRMVPHDVDLVVALDRDLERIERVDATSALSAISDITSTVAGEQAADCVFGKVSGSEMAAMILSNAPPKSSDLIVSQDETRENGGDSIERMYGVFLPGRTPILNTIINREEAVKTAVHRLKPQLYALLATKLLQLTVNQGASHLGVRATIEVVVPQERVLLQQSTPRSPWTPPDTRLAALFAGNGQVPAVTIGNQIRYRLHNYGDRPIYCLFIHIDSRGDMMALYPATVDPEGLATGQTVGMSVIPANAIVRVPPAEQALPWTVSGPPGLVTTYVVVSSAPFTETTEVLPQLKQPISSARRLTPLSEPLVVTQALLSDLHNASKPALESLGLDGPSDRYALETGCWATLNFTYRVVDRA